MIKKILLGLYSLLSIAWIGMLLLYWSVLFLPNFWLKYDLVASGRLGELQEIVQNAGVAPLRLALMGLALIIFIALLLILLFLQLKDSGKSKNRNRHKSNDRTYRKDEVFENYKDDLAPLTVEDERVPFSEQPTEEIADDSPSDSFERQLEVYNLELQKRLTKLEAEHEFFKETLDNHSKTLENQGKSIASNNDTLVSHTRHLEAQDKTLENLSKLSESNSQSIDNHSTLLFNIEEELGKEQ